MNYLAHLFLAQPTADSHFGNMLGDFGGLTKVTITTPQILRGLKNHYLVDKYTDNHQLVRKAKTYFSAKNKRFSGIALDVLFDHFLIKHWHLFHQVPFATFKQQSYRRLGKRQELMPDRMKHTVSRIILDDWFESYKTVTGIYTAIENISKRIHFKNNFSSSTQDIDQYYSELEHLFLQFFPELMLYIAQQGPENQHK